MPEKEPRLMEADYMQDFHCRMSRCRTTCCQGWDISFSRADYMKVRSKLQEKGLSTWAENALQRNKKSADDRFYGRFHLRENGLCPLLREDGLCGLQLECGAGVLPEICIEFPRREFVIDRTMTRGCSPGCEETVALLWNRRNGISYLEKPMPRKMFSNRLFIYSGRPGLENRILELHMMAAAILRNRSYTLDGRLILVGMALLGISDEKTSTSEEIDAWVAKYMMFAKGSDFTSTLQQLPSNLSMSLSNSLRTIHSLNTVSQDWVKEKIKRLESKVGYREENGQAYFSTESYYAGKENFDRKFGMNDTLLENILVNELLTNIPLMRKDSSLWECYIRFCIEYSLLKFILFVGIDDSMKREDVIQLVVLWARIVPHALTLLKSLASEMHANHSDTLAHMAILVNG